LRGDVDIHVLGLVSDSYCYILLGLKVLLLY